MASIIPRLVPYVVIDDDTDVLVKNVTSPGVNRTCTVAAGTYLCSGDGSASDLVKVFEDAVTGAAVGGDLDDFTCTINLETGHIEMSSDDTDTYIVTWDTPGFVVRNALGYSGTIDTFSGPGINTSDRVHLNGFYPNRVAVEDLPRANIKASTNMPDSGRPQTIYYFTHYEQKVGFKFKGHPRSSTFNEIQDLEDFMLNHAGKGKWFRHYPDRTITDAYVRVTTPYGYQDYYLHPDDRNWTPEPVTAGWHGYFDEIFRFLKKP